MSEIEFSKPIKKIKGKIYDGLVIKLSPQGKLIVAKLPDMSKVKWSPAQKAHRKHFSRANTYAKAAMADPKARKIYEKIAKKQKRQPYRVAFSDYCDGNNLLEKK
jgi:hypothetical protein